MALAGTEKTSDTHLEGTADFVYMRWEGDRKAVNGLKGKIVVDRTADLRIWAEKLRGHLDAGMAVFGYFGKYYSGLPPHDIATLKGFLQRSANIEQ